LIGPIRGKRLPAGIKRQIVGAVTDAKKQGMSILRACEILMIDARRVRRWIGGRDPEVLSSDDLVDTPPVAKVCPHRLTDAERQEIVTSARDEKLAHLRHRKLTHTLSRQDECSAHPRARFGCCEQRAWCPCTPPFAPAETAARNGRVRAQPDVAL
jgi:hypothetical protein